jgi:ABC-2 type transport system ATP-binding protein
VSNAIECRGLSKRYRDTLAVDALDLTVEDGEIFGFLGPNGAGKTTTLRMLLGLIRPTAGSARVNGHELRDRRGLATVGALVEEPAFYPWMRGRANIEVLAAAGNPVSARAIDEAMARTGIGAAANRKVKTYSQGMRQRLGLAAALLRRPRLLLLDEPTNGLDPRGIQDLRELLRDVAAEGTTVFLSSHLLSEVERLCHRVAIVSQGRLAALGTLEELALGRHTVRVEVAPGDQARALELLQRLDPRVEGPGVLRLEGGSGRQAAELLANGGVYPEALAVERPGVEELFMAVTAKGGPHAPARR